MTFVALFHSDRSPVDAGHEFGGRSGIEAGNIRILGRWGQAAFATFDGASAAASSAAIVTLNRHHWLIGRVRLDGRSDLIASLAHSDNGEFHTLSDPHLCLAAYDRWGMDCFQRLSGDVCFALWDETQQAMLCARDQLGVRPLHYANDGNRWLISDAVDRISSRLGPKSSLDPLWITDFLTAGYCLDPDRTVFSAVKRIPPAHYLRLAEARNELRRYWKLEVTEPLHFVNPRHYIEEFHAKLSMAVADRMPPGRVGVSMSGGIDSSTLAAKAVEVAGDPSRVVAQTGYFRSLLPDTEAHYSRLVAEKLGIQQNLVATDDLWYEPNWQSRGAVFAQPSLSITNSGRSAEIWAATIQEASVWFYGEGPDNALTFEWRCYLRWLAARRSWGHLAEATVDYLRTKSAREWITTLNLKKRRKLAAVSSPTAFDWLNEEFASQARDRLQVARPNYDDVYSWRPGAMGQFNTTVWQNFFEVRDPAESALPIDWRHPYLDLRVLTFLLAVPPIPWARNKRLFREAMRGILPAEILQRPKTPLSGDPLAITLRKNPLSELPHDSPVNQYIDRTKIAARGTTNGELYQFLHVSVLDHWLRTRGYT